MHTHMYMHVYSHVSMNACMHIHTHTTRSRETENLEYIKNIIIHYMSADSAGREQMLIPIATVLHFSQEEVCIFM